MDNKNIDLVFNFKYTIFLFLFNLKNQIIKLIETNELISNSIKTITDNKLIVFGSITGYLGLSLNVLFVWTINLYIFYSIYWIFLGVLSTIGLGFGLQTGIFFVIPYILEECKYNYKLNVFITTLPIVILWGFGSALGEIPPFLLAKYSNKTNMLKSIQNSSFIKIIDIIKNHRFKTILFMSAWPNVTFDMCGMICGYNGLTLYEFLLPTIIGKALIKSPGQSLCVIYAYSYYTDYTQDNETSLIKENILFLWNGLFSCIVLYFIKMSIESIARLE